MLAKFHGNILNLSENIPKSFRGATFLTYTVDNCSFNTRSGITRGGGVAGGGEAPRVIPG